MTWDWAVFVVSASYCFAVGVAMRARREWSVALALAAIAGAIALSALIEEIPAG